MGRLLRLLLLHFPDHCFLFVGDSGYGSHAVARFVCRHRDRLALASKLHPDANLFEPPPPYRGKGRPRVKGAALPRPREAAAQRRRLRRAAVGWYGGGSRRVGIVRGEGHWYKAGAGLVPLRWVFVRDQSGTHRDEYFFTTDLTLSPEAIISHYTGRWSIECTLEELRASRPGDDARLVSADGAACRAVPVRALHGRGVALQCPAGGEACRHGELAGKANDDLLRCLDRGAAVAVGGMGFPAGRSRYGRGKTPATVTGDNLLRPRSRCINCISRA
jgi:hypothetical protein